MSTIYKGMHRMTNAEATNQFGTEFGQDNVTYVADVLNGLTVAAAGSHQFASGLRAQGTVVETTGAGVELRFDPAGTGGIYGVLASIDRAATAYRAMFYTALSHTFALSGSAVFGLSSGAGWFGASDPGGTALDVLRANGNARATTFVGTGTGDRNALLRSIRASDAANMVHVRRWNGTGSPVYGGADGPHLVVCTEDAGGDVVIGTAGIETARFLSANQNTQFKAEVSFTPATVGALRQIKVGAANSAGAGFRTLFIDN
jgi:hypothetical protein